MQSDLTNRTFFQKFIKNYLVKCQTKDPRAEARGLVRALAYSPGFSLGLRSNIINRALDQNLAIMAIAKNLLYNVLEVYPGFCSSKATSGLKPALREGSPPPG
jgi:hypothetical protein